MKNDRLIAKLRIERDLGNNKGHVRVYEVGRYQVIIRGDKKSTGEHLYVEIRYGAASVLDMVKERSYLPYLYASGCFDDEGDVCRVNIGVGTTSYGVLSLDETERFMEEMQEGIDAAKYIGEKFIKPMVERKWNWEVVA